MVGEKILEAARATDIVVIQSGTQSNLCSDAVDVIPSNKLFANASRTLMADMMVNAWDVVKIFLPLLIAIQQGV